ncbi:MAG: helix-turn-helix transcriptional regulator [Treponemataceae bacterium]
MNLNQVLLLSSGGALFLGIFIALLLFSYRGDGARSRKVLGILVLVSSLNASHPIVIGLVFAFRETGLRLFEPMQFLMAPLIAAYVRSLLPGGLRVRPFLFLHALPFFAAVVFAVLFSFGSIHPTRPDSFVLSAVFWSALVLQVLSYLVPTFRLLRSHSIFLKDRVSSLAGIDLGWLRWFFAVILVLCAGYLVLLAFLLHDPGIASLRSHLSLAMTVLVWALGYRGLIQKTVPLEVIPPKFVPAALNERSALYERSALAAPEAKRIKAALLETMERDKPYLRPELSLADLADALGTQRNQLSFVINTEFAQNFYDFVNDFRLREFRALLADPGRRDDKLLTLALDAGFNSKPAFNAVFKKKIGMTPSQYREKQNSGLVGTDKTI